jgi:isoleucyl-tRNA synthetase
LVGKDVLVKGNAAMLQLLKKEKRSVKSEKIAHRYPYDWKTNEPVIVTYDTSFFCTTIFHNFHFHPLLQRDITVVCQSGWHQGRCAQRIEISVILPSSL